MWLRLILILGFFYTPLGWSLNSKVSAIPAKVPAGLLKSKATPFQNKNDLIHFICNKQAHLPSFETMKQELAVRRTDKLIAPRTVDELVKGFKAFRYFNLMIPKIFNVSTINDWKLENQDMKEYPCQYKVKKQSKVNFHQMNFSKLSFVGTSHFSKMQEAQLLQARLDLETKLNSIKPDVLLIEGKEFGKPIECGAVLSDALSEDRDLKSEMRATIKYGFWNQIPLVPADNQDIDSNDLSFFQGDSVSMEASKDSFTFIKTLHLYHDLLAQAAQLNIDQTKILETALLRSQNKMSVEQFLDYYKKLNQRNLPNDPSEVKQDFSPSIVAKTARGSNKVADSQNEIRNQALIKAIQITSSKFSRPAALYGSGHLGQVGQTLEKYLGKPTNIDFDSACPP